MSGNRTPVFHTADVRRMGHERRSPLLPVYTGVLGQYADGTCPEPTRYDDQGDDQLSMEAWQGILGRLATPTMDGRFLLPPQELDRRELPLPLHLTGTMFNAQIGVITDMTIVNDTLTGAGDIDLRLLNLLNTPMADALAAGRPAGIMLDFSPPPMRSGSHAPVDAPADPRDPLAWGVRGAYLHDRPAWPGAQIWVGAPRPNVDVR